MQAAARGKGFEFPLPQRLDPAQQSVPGDGFGRLAEVSVLFSVDGLLLAGWIHYLAFDLFVGSWEVEDARPHGVPHWVVLPCLLATFRAGPAGLLLDLLLRFGIRALWVGSTPMPERRCAQC